MLYRYINQFLEYCWLVDFSIRYIQASDKSFSAVERILILIRNVPEVPFLQVASQQ